MVFRNLEQKTLCAGWLKWLLFASHVRAVVETIVNDFLVEVTRHSSTIHRWSWMHCGSTHTSCSQQLDDSTSDRAVMKWMLHHCHVRRVPRSSRCRAMTWCFCVSTVEPSIMSCWLGQCTNVQSVRLLNLEIKRIRLLFRYTTWSIHVVWCFWMGATPVRFLAN